MRVSYLDLLEYEAIYFIRESVKYAKKPAILFSGGKDSITLIHLAKKAFPRGNFPFKIIHIDTGHNFPEIINYRDAIVKKFNLELIVGYVEETIKEGKAQDEKGPWASRIAIQSITLIDVIKKEGFDFILGGGRREEEKARSKEKIFSFRDIFGGWDYRKQRSEPWYIFNTLKKDNEHFRVFPLSNWSEFDVWLYIWKYNVPIAPLYFAHWRKCIFRKNGIILPYNTFIELLPDDEVKEAQVRFRTIGDMTCTAAILSKATTVEEIIEEIITHPASERSTRADDMRSPFSMEERKKMGYF